MMAETNYEMAPGGDLVLILNTTLQVQLQIFKGSDNNALDSWTDVMEDHSGPASLSV